jgi:hypothetical protein
MKKGKYGKIDPKFKKQWIEALESGKYEQTNGCLQNLEGQYCCLGVACELTGVGNFIEAPFDEYEYALPEYNENMYKDEKIVGDGVMPVNLRRKIKLTKRAQTRLYKMNDNGVSFKEIAKWIRKYL